MDQATLVGFAFGYLATFIVIFILCLPFTIGLVLLMLLAGAVRLILFLATALTVGLIGLFKSARSSLRRSTPGARHGSDLITH